MRVVYPHLDAILETLGQEDLDVDCGIILKEGLFHIQVPHR